MEVTSANIEKYNFLCLHYDVVARSCYSYRRNMAHALSDDYFPYLISALIVFDMQRKMGKGLRQKYDREGNGFASRLSNIIYRNRDSFFSLELLSIDAIDISIYEEIISNLYSDFAVDGALDSQGHAFDVGATKLLHFIHPSLFPIIDSNSAKVLRVNFEVDYNNSSRPGYSSAKYLDSMRAIQRFINAHGKSSLEGLEHGTPITRIFDKLAFVEGAGL